MAPLAGVRLGTQWAPQTPRHAWAARVPASAWECNATYFCAVCCAAEAAKPAAARAEGREILAFRGLPAYVEHCLGHSSRHFAFARAWRAAEQYIGTTLGGALPDYGVFTREVARLAADAVGSLAWPWQL